MSIESQIVICLAVYKIITLLVGFSSLYMGYRLFVSGIWGNSGDVDVKFEKTNVVIKNAAPGTFFAILGALIILFSVYKGLDFKREMTKNGLSEERKSNEVDQQLPEKSPIK